MPQVDEAKEAENRHWEAVKFRGAVGDGDMEKVDELLGEGFNPTYKMTDGCTWSVLMIAASAGQQAMVEKFTKGGRNPKIDEKDPNGLQAISIAALRGHRAICEILLDKKADVNATDEDGETSLMKASSEGYSDVVQLLLSRGADPDAEDKNAMSAIKKAARHGHTQCVAELLPKVKDDHRQFKHCLLFGKLNNHQGVIDVMTEKLEPKVEEEPETDEALGGTGLAAPLNG